MIYDKIESWCTDNGTSISALEKKCKLGNATIRGWKDSIPKITTLIRVSQVTGIPINEMLDDGKGAKV